MYANNFDQNSMAGRTLGPELSSKVVNSIPPVGIALDQLEKELHHLREAVGQLEHRLSVVMRPMPVGSDSSAKPMTAGGSPLVSQVDALAQLTRNTSADLFAMLDCLEL